MPAETCHAHRESLERIAAGEPVAVPDSLALHLDTCAECRRLFDRAIVPLEPEALERLAPEARRRLLEVLVSRSPRRWRRAALAAGVAALALAAGWLVPWPRPAGDSPPLVMALVEDHIRYLGHPERQNATGRPGAEAELEAYVDFPVTLPAAATAELTGARRCFVLGRRVALGFYQAGNEELSYFLMPAEGVELPEDRCVAGGFRCAAQRGYSLVAWENSGLLHAVVSADAGAALAFARETRVTDPSAEPKRITDERR